MRTHGSNREVVVVPERVEAPVVDNWHLTCPFILRVRCCPGGSTVGVFCSWDDDGLTGLEDVFVDTLQGKESVNLADKRCEKLV
jgi:hypothetical protein